MCSLLTWLIPTNDMFILLAATYNCQLLMELFQCLQLVGYILLIFISPWIWKGGDKMTSTQKHHGWWLNSALPRLQFKGIKW